MVPIDFLVFDVTTSNNVNPLF